MGRFATAMKNPKKLQMVIGNECFSLLQKLDLSDDDKIFAEFAKIEKKVSDNSYNTAKIRYLAPYSQGIKRILDFGGANGLIAGAMHKEFHVFVDVVDVHDGKKFLNLPGTTYIQTVGDLKLTENYSIVTSFMVFHHVPPKDMPQIVKELHAHIEPNGYLILQEHDCTDDVLRAIIDIQHGMYMFVWKDEDYDSRTFDEYEAWYLNIDKMAKYFDPYFQPVKFFRTNRVTNNYVAVYKKIKPETKLINLVNAYDKANKRF